jgi:Heterokaryon incompatibility protein (HET)
MDMEERSLQVRRIDTLFKKASEVAVWLGDEADTNADAVQPLCAGKHPGLDPDACLSTLPVFNDLLDRLYWKRVWIIQELAVASCINRGPPPPPSLVPGWWVKVK